MVEILSSYLVIVTVHFLDCEKRDREKKGKNLLMRLFQLLLRFSSRHTLISAHFEAKSYDIWYHEIVRSHNPHNLTKLVYIIFKQKQFMTSFSVLIITTHQKVICIIVNVIWL